MVPPGAVKRRGPTVGVKVTKGRNQIRFAVGAGDPPGTKLPGGVPLTYPRGPDPLNVWGS